uniref:Small ribosomal subunit protein uS2c n=1 Tax=Kirchneriella aperta TaxID=117505 RepID=A0A140H9Y7_9CHLO|nr:ribosomal protein S2 [Kirchneriella aperta]AMO00986.1 ribosomal protein S2 [Kirchneriella aperta]
MTQIKKNSFIKNEGNIFSNSQNKNLKKLKLKVGDISVVTINALGTKNVGLAELQNGYTLIVPKAKLGETVKIQIEKISLKPKYAIAKVVEILKETKTTVPVKINDVLEIVIEKQGPQGSGLYSLSEKFTIIVQPKSKGEKNQIGEKLNVQITRIKAKYAFAKFIEKNIEKRQSVHSENPLLKSNNLNSSLLMTNGLFNSLPIGSTYNIKLPLNAKCLASYALIKLKKSLVFVKMGLGVQLGETVRIKIVKTTPDYAIAKITKIAPLAKNAKQLLVKNTVKKMIASGMHYGEKAIRCHANMRKFLWIRKKGKNQNRPLMKRGRHIINVLKTRTCLNRALQQLAKYAAKGKTFLFVGTKKPAASLIARTAMLSKTSYFVNTRWLGGMLTNWKTILKSISQIRPILKEKQKMIQKILEKRQKIKKRLLKKVNLLRKKSEKLLMKGKQLLAQIQQDRNILFVRSQALFIKKAEITARNEQLLRKYSELKAQKQKRILQLIFLQEKGNQLIKQKTTLIQQINKSKQKFEEFKQLNQIGQEIIKLKKEMNTQGKTIWAVPFENITILSQSDKNWIIPNPSNQILNKMINTMKLKYEKNILTVNNSELLGGNLEGKNRSKSVTNDTVIISQLLNKLTDYLPFIQSYMKALVLRIQTLQTLCIKVHENIQTIREKISLLKNLTLTLKIDSTLTLIKEKLYVEKENLRLLKRKLKQLSAEQKLLKFLPKLRYLPTSKKKMYETVEFLMKKFVDPKMSYSMDQVYDQKLKFTSKKLAATRKQKWQRLEKYFGGITKMAKMKRKQIANNVVILVGQQEEMNAVRECRKLGMRMFTVVDTNCNPRLSDYIIPANDDSRNSIKFILGQILTHIRLGQKLRKKILSKRSV